MAVGLRVVGILLFPFVLLYTLIVFLRNKIYDWDWLMRCEINALVISVGNIQMGGTGKTPFVEWLAEKMSEMNIEPIILTRGYGRSPKIPIIIDNQNRSDVTWQQVGDEPFQLAWNLPGIKIGVDANRCRMAGRILNENSEALFLLDDGFQHRRMRRNLDIVLVDVSRWSGVPLLFPVTSFRDVKSSLARAGIIVLTRSENNSARARELKSGLQNKLKIPVFEASIHPRKIVSITDDRNFEPKKLHGKKIAAFCGLGNSAQYFRLLEDLGAEIVWQRAFPDHHVYIQSVVEEIAFLARQHGAEMTLTTQKDAVKLEEILSHLNPDMSFYYIRIAIALEDETALLKQIREIKDKFAGT